MPMTRIEKGDRQPSDLVSADLPPPSTTLPWAAPILATSTRAPAALTGARRTGRPTARHFPIFRKSPGTTPAPVSCSLGFLAFPRPYGSSGLCNSLDAEAFPILVAVDGGGGGPSSCATGAPSTPGVVSGSCAGWSKPSYQSVFGNPSDGVRDLPDISLFAADGLLGHCYVLCDTHNASCSGAPSTWPCAGGTSFASPIMAGIQALVDQSTGSSRGESKSLLLLPRPHRVWRERQLFLQLDPRQWRGQFMYLPRRNPRRHGRTLHYRRP